MTVLEFYQTIGAVFAANMLTLVMVYGLWRISRHEKETGVPNSINAVPLLLRIGMAVGPLLTALAATTLR